MRKVIEVERIDLGYPQPEYKTEFASGMDLCAHTLKKVYIESQELSTDGFITEENFSIPPLGRVLFGTGLKCNIPDGFELQIRPRSGLSLKRGLVAAFGTVDQDYHGEIMVNLINTTCYTQQIEKNERIAQIVLCPVYTIKFNTVESFKDSYDRGEAGFGSTGN